MRFSPDLAVHPINDPEVRALSDIRVEPFLEMGKSWALRRDYPVRQGWVAAEVWQVIC